jgi:hypothetical protein
MISQSPFSKKINTVIVHFFTDTLTVSDNVKIFQYIIPNAGKLFNHITRDKRIFTE